MDDLSFFIAFDFLKYISELLNYFFIRFNKDDNDKGKSTFYSLAARFYFGNWLQSVQYSKTKGFYVDKDDIGSAENVVFPNLQVERYSGSTRRSEPSLPERKGFWLPVTV